MLQYIILQLLLICSKLLNSFLSRIGCSYSTYSGSKESRAKAERDYDRCVHRTEILMKAKPFPLKDAELNKNFLLRHRSYISTDALLSDRVSLMGFGCGRAFFASVPENNDLYDLEDDQNPFFLVRQFDRATEILSLSLDHFLRFAEELGFPKCNVVLLWHTGRCGSTLLAKMMSSASSNTVCVIESDILTQIHQVSSSSSEKDSLALIEAAVRAQCKSMPSSVENVVIKPRGSNISLLPLVCQACPYARHVFLHRDPVTTVASLVAMYRSDSWMQNQQIQRSERVLGQYALGRDIVGEGLAREMRAEQERDYDHVRNWSQLLGMRYLSYRRARRQQLQGSRSSILLGLEGGDETIMDVRYEDLMADPERTLRTVLRHCQMEADGVARGLEVMGKDSQRNSQCSRERLSKSRRRLTEEEVDVVNQSFLRLGLPPIDDFDTLFVL